MEKDNEIETLKERILKLEKQVNILTGVVSGMDSKKNDNCLIPTVESLLQPYNDKVFIIGKEILECYSMQQFNRIKDKYKRLLNEVKGKFSDEVYNDFLKKKNNQVLKCYNSVKFRWLPNEEKEKVINKTVPLNNIINYELYFSSSKDAFDYIINNASNENEAKTATLGVCKGYAGLNEDFYTQYVLLKWRKLHNLLN